VNQRRWTWEQMEVSCPKDSTVLHLCWAQSPVRIKKQNIFFSGVLYPTEPNSWTIHIQLSLRLSTWVGWKVLRMLLFLFPGIRRGNAVLGFVKVIHWRVWPCSWTAVAFSIRSQQVEAPSTFCHGGWGRCLCENTAEVCDWILC